MANRIQLRRGGAQEWANSNPTLAQGELGIELDTGRFKLGDGVSAWNSLRYERPVESTSNTANTLVQRDADGNFSAGTITSTLIGNASTATRLASTRQIQLSGDVQSSGVFDGSANLTLNSALGLVSTLPHYDGTATPTGTYTKLTVDAKGRITNATNPTTLADYNLNGTVEGSSAQPYDLDLVAVAGLTSTGLISRTSTGTMATRAIAGTATRIAITDGSGLSGNPTIDLITTAVTGAAYNTASLTSIAGSQTVNTTAYTVDDYGRLTASVALPIATAVEGTDALAYAAGTTYVRDDKITNASKLYQAIAGIAAGAGAPTHSDATDAGSWRYLGAVTTKQKGLASFAQEDFDVSAAGHVTISANGVDNTQLQNRRIGFADGNTVENFELDQELTATSGYRGFNYLNYIKVNDTSGNLLFGANNTGDSSAGEIDVNVRSYFSDPDITLDGAVAQTLDKTGDGNLTFQTTQNSTSARTLSILATNAGTGASGVVVTAENTVTITASDAAGKVQIEDIYLQGDYIASSAATMILDPGDDRATSGKVQIMGDLQVDGTTTTVNSTVTTLDDPIITLGGDTAPGSDDGKDRGVEFRYYDTQARVGFFGYDDSAADLGGHSGAFSFVYDATNTAEVFAGTDAGIIAGNLKLTTNTNSTSNTTGDLVVAGGVGIGDDVNIGGTLDVDTNFRTHGTSRFDDEVVIQGASKDFIMKNGSGTAKFTAGSTTGNLTMAGVLAVTGNVDVNSNKFNITAASGNTAIAGTLTVSDETIVKADNKTFKVQTAAGVDKFVVDTDNGNLDSAGGANIAGLVYLESTDEPDILSGAPHTIQNADYGALRVDGGGYFDKNVLFNGDIFLNGDFNQQEDATENYGLRNYLSIRYKMRAGSVAAYTPSYSNHNTSNLRVFGGAGINTTLHVGGTGASQGLFVGKKNSGDTVKFSVLGASGDITSEGTLTQNGNAEFNGTVDVDGNFAVRNSTTDKFTVASSTGNAVGEGDLNIKGAVDFDTTLNVDGATTIQDDLIVKSDNKTFKVQNASAADKFTIDTDNGNTETQGTLTVQGQTNIIDSLVINAANENLYIQNGSAVTKFSVDTDNGNTNIIGTLTVGDATQINDTFGVSGVVTATNNTEQTLTGSYAADGSVRLSGGVGLAKNLAVGGDARVYGTLEVTQTVDINDAVDVSGNLVVSNTQEATSLADASVALQVAGGATIDKNTYIGGNLVVYDAGNTRAAFTVTNSSGDGEFHNDLTIGGNLIVNGSTTTVNSTVTTLDDPIITLGGDTAPSSNDAKDRGVEFRYYDGSAKIGFFGFDRSTQEFAFLTSATNTSEVLAGTDGPLRVGSINVTGAGTSVDIDNNLNVDGTATVDGQIISQLAQGTAPFVIASTTKVNNLNADLLDGMTTATANTVSTVVNRDGSGNFAAGTITAALTGNASTSTEATNVTVSANNTANETVYLTFVDGATGTQGVETDTGLNYNPSTGILTTTQVTGNVVGDVTGDLTGTADVATTITLADESTDTSCNVLFATAATGNLAAKTGTNLTFNSNTGILTATGFSGPITGEVTGNAATATVLATARNIGGVSFNGSADITLPGVNSSGNQDTSGNAATATALATARNIGGVSFDGTAAINLPGVNTAGNQDTSGNAATSTQAANLTNHNTGGLSEGTNLYYTEARVQAKLDNAYSQLKSMLNNLATSTTLTMNLSGDPTPGVVVTLGSITANGIGGFSSASNVATSGGTGSSLTVDTTVNAAGAITGIALNTAGTDYLVSDTLTITNPNLGGVSALNVGTLSAGTGYATGTTIATTSSGSGSACTVDITGVSGTGAITGISINANGSGYAIGETLTIANANATGAKTLGSIATAGTGYAAGSAIATSASGSGSSATVDITVDGSGAVTGVTINDDGTGYAASEVLTITNANASGVKTLGSISVAGTGYTTASGVATTSSGSGTGLTVDVTVSSGGLATLTINNDGSGYAASDTITVVNANASGVKTLGTISAAGTGYTEGSATGVSTTASGSGTGLTVDIVVDASGNVTSVAINNDGSGYAASEVITIAGEGDGNATIPVSAIHGNGGTSSVSAIHGNGATIPVSAIHGNGASINTSTVFTNATFALSDITTMEVGATVTGGTSGTTGVITALGTNAITVNTVDGFFKVGETVGANDVTNLTISSFA